ncbi:hypothetical protein [Maribacter halichondriae]|uniref:hypothetical protein n=1 Tax=Maribacter halichondriae TaxID=2980554 RepID=UPI0023585E2E|nr:hypothetical protein [Maribacter sp. Hal144]
MKNFKILFAIAFVGMISTNISAQEITSFPGMWGEQFYQDKEKLSWKEINTIMMESPVSEGYWKKSKKQALGGMLFGAANFGSSIWLLSNLDKNEPLTAPLITAAGTGLIGAIFFKSAMKNKKMAILEYNDSLGNTTSFHLVPVSNRNGLGLALQFN